MSALFCLFLCFRSYPEKLEEYIPTFYKIGYILEELYVAVLWIISRLIIYIDQMNTAYQTKHVLGNTTYIMYFLQHTDFSSKNFKTSKRAPRADFYEEDDHNGNSKFPFIFLTRAKKVMIKWPFFVIELFL